MFASAVPCPDPGVDPRAGQLHRADRRLGIWQVDPCERLIRLRDGAVIDDIEIAGGHPVDETVQRAGQLG